MILSTSFRLLWMLPTLLLSTTSTIHHCHAFTSTINSRASRLQPNVRTYRTVQYNNFWKGLLDSAFENDRSLSTVDQRKGMLEGPNNNDNADNDDSKNRSIPLTDVQRAWRERQQPSSPTNVDLLSSLLQDSIVTLDLYLVGIPSKDPSSDLYGSRVNISNRNKELGLDVPAEPNGGSVDITLLPDGVCRCSPSPFTEGSELGQWKLSDDGTQLRFSIYALGYSRTIQTKGSIERVFWSDQPEATRQTSSQYSIPPGWVYGDIQVRTSRPGVLDLKTGGSGVLRVEQAVGLLGVATKLVACGTFDAKVKYDTDDDKSTNVSNPSASPSASDRPRGGVL